MKGVKGRTPRVSDDQIRAAIAVGMSPRQIARHFGYDRERKYIYARLKRMGVVPNPYSQGRICAACPTPIMDWNKSGVCAYCNRRRRHYGAHEDLVDV